MSRLDMIFASNELCERLIESDVNVLQHIKTELLLQLQEIPNNWDPHFRLDFIKSALHSIIAEWADKKKEKR